MKAFFLGCGALFGILLTLFLTVFFIAAVHTHFWATPACAAFGEGMKLQTEFRFWYGCFVTMPDGRIMPTHIAEDVMRKEYLFKHQSVR